MAVRNVRAKNFPVNIDVDLAIHTKTLNSVERTCSKVRNGVFATHRTIDTLDVVHRGGHAVAISEIHGDTPSTIF